MKDSSPLSTTSVNPDRAHANTLTIQEQNVPAVSIIGDLSGANPKKTQDAPEGWLTNKGLARQLHRDKGTTKRLTSQFRDTNSEWFFIYLDSCKRPKEHYSPELVNLVSEENSKTKPAPEGWVTNRALARQLHIHQTTTK